MELGDNFTVEMKGWVDTDNGTEKWLVHKPGAFGVKVSDTVAENITAGILGGENLLVPTSHVDAATAWTSDNLSYDDDWGTFAESNVANNSWSEWLELQHSAVWCNSIKFKWEGKGANERYFNLSVYYDDAWQGVITGNAEPDATTTEDLGGTYSVNSTRIRIYNRTGGAVDEKFYELAFGADDFDTTTVTATGVESGEHSVKVRQEVNLLKNGDFEDGGTPPANWTLSGAGASSGTDTVTKRINASSANLTRNGSNCLISQDIADYARYAGKEVTLGAWIYATVASRARIGMYDGQTSSYSSFHSGVAGWEWISFTKTIDSSPTRLQASCWVVTGDTTAYFDGAVLIAGDDFEDFEGNMLSNWSFENGDPPDDWGFIGAGGTRSQSTEQTKIGAYTVKVTNAGADTLITYSVPNPTEYQGDTVTLGCWAWTDEPNRSYIQIYDGVSTSQTAWHSGDSSWEWLTVTKTLAPAASQIRIRPYVWTVGTTYFDGIILVEGDADALDITKRIDHLQILVDDEWQDSAYKETVPDNSNDWVLCENNVMPYGGIEGDAAFYQHSVPPTTRVVHYEPNDIITGTVLPDRAGGDHPGAFTWGSNPTGVSVSMGGLVSSSQPAVGLVAEDATPDIMPGVEITDWYTEPDVGGILLTFPLRPFVTILSDTTTLTELQAWRILGTAFLLMVRQGRLFSD